MSETKPRVSIVGLGTIGSSLGLALRQAGVVSSVIGHDKDPGVASLARKLEAVDKTHWRLIPACEDADLVVLAIPMGAVKETLEAIAPTLRDGCVVLNTAPLMTPILDWVGEHLPEGAIWH